MGTKKKAGGNSVIWTKSGSEQEAIVSVGTP
jgi:hypothetical protein